MIRYNSVEFYNLIKDYYYHDKVQMMANYKHHGLDRLSHCLRVSYYTFKVTKFLRLNYEDATIAALLHDFFLNEVEGRPSLSRYRDHPYYALKNTDENFCINEFQKDIIIKHMFPFTFSPPKYLEGWIVDFIDNVASVYEKCCSIEAKAKAAITSIGILLISIIK